MKSTVQRALLAKRLALAEKPTLPKEPEMPELIIGFDTAKGPDQSFLVLYDRINQRMMEAVALPMHKLETKYPKMVEDAKRMLLAAALAKYPGPLRKAENR